MTMTLVESPLLRMTQETPTDYWNDSCAVEELAYAVERGATGATSNPSIVLEVMKKEKAHWVPRVHELRGREPDLARGRAHLGHRRGDGRPGRGDPRARCSSGRGGRKGRLSVQTNPANYRDPAGWSSRRSASTGSPRTSRSSSRPPPPASRRSRRRPLRGVNINATVSFTVAPGARRRPRRSSAASPDGRPPARTSRAMTPIVTIMIGRLDDWMKVLVERDDLAVHPDAPNWAGIAAFKRAYAIFRERGYRSRLLAAAYRHRLHWTELVGGDVSMTMPYAWQVRFNASGIVPEPRMDVPVEPRPRRRAATSGSRTSGGRTSPTA